MYMSILVVLCVTSSKFTKISCISSQTHKYTGFVQGDGGRGKVRMTLMVEGFPICLNQQ